MRRLANEHSAAAEAVAHSEGSQVCHVRSRQEDVPRHVVDHVLQVLDRVLPSHLLIRQAADELSWKTRNHGQMARSVSVPFRSFSSHIFFVRVIFFQTEFSRRSRLQLLFQQNARVQQPPVST